MSKILVVDDEREILELLKTFLEGKDFQVATCCNGEDALNAIRQDKSIDLVILDVRMPKLDGGAVLKELRDEENNIPIIILTGSLSGNTRSLDADAFIMKPIGLTDLLDKVNELLEK